VCALWPQKNARPWPAGRVPRRSVPLACTGAAATRGDAAAVIGNVTHGLREILHGVGALAVIAREPYVADSKRRWPGARCSPDTYHRRAENRHHESRGSSADHWSAARGLVAVLPSVMVRWPVSLALAAQTHSTTQEPGEPYAAPAERIAPGRAPTGRRRQNPLDPPTGALSTPGGPAAASGSDQA
jgi:hypothetical protein